MHICSYICDTLLLPVIPESCDIYYSAATKNEGRARPPCVRNCQNLMRRRGTLLNVARNKKWKSVRRILNKGGSRRITIHLF